jgi:ubiquinone/menaquinone biosynthesis C-methylase UbiE
VLDLLVGDLAYREDRQRFRTRHDALLGRLELRDLAAGSERADLQGQQQKHFDWYAANETQSYLEYESMPFWVAVDSMTFERWRPTLRPGGWLLDVGCGNGRSASHLMDLDLRVLGFDVARAAVRQAQQRFGDGKGAARATFFTADATRFPVRSASLDHVLVYGVLHHVPDPRVACAEIARVLKPGGTYLGSENNHTVFRALFDLLQRLRPVWYEEAGPEALISSRVVRDAFAGTGVAVSTRTFVFVPPHLVNLLPRGWGGGLLRWTDAVGGALPGLRSNGGLILIEGERRVE